MNDDMRVIVPVGVGVNKLTNSDIALLKKECEIRNLSMRALVANILKTHCVKIKTAKRKGEHESVRI